jgi:hypothetical protein
MELWPWWLGAVGLAGTALLYTWIVRRPLGVSGFVGTALSPQAQKDEVELAGLSDADLERAMLDAARAQFGDAALAEAAAAPASSARAVSAAPALGWGRSVAFLVGSVLGGGLFALVGTRAGGANGLELAPMGTYVDAFGAWTWVALVAGGICVGAGTAMAGGCTSGHGLVGCGRLQPPSLVATACFFGTAIAVGFAIKAFLLGGGGT